MTDDKPQYNRRSAPSAQRNRTPILDFLSPILTRTGTVLEVGSGTGEHAAWFAPRLPHITWQPTEANDGMHASISAWAVDADAPNLRPPLTLDVVHDIWPPAKKIDDLVAVVAICVAHISPWAVTEELFRSAAKYLPSGGILVLYGPYSVNGVHTPPRATPSLTPSCAAKIRPGACAT